MTEIQLTLGDETLQLGDLVDSDGEVVQSGDSEQLTEGAELEFDYKLVANADDGGVALHFLLNYTDEVAVGVLANILSDRLQDAGAKSISIAGEKVEASKEAVQERLKELRE
jgi:hypothetical protein